ncbi:MAG: hypothetical protein HYV97_12440 [Bdellovibrio sp.]|nr:hypothetical protein [Bdellovibrio sp.]
MSIIETIMGLCLMLIITAMVQAFNMTLTKQMILKEQQLIKMTGRYQDQWNARP